jgi:hypothetical protein
MMRIYLIHDVWQRVAQSVTVHNLAAASKPPARGSPRDLAMASMPVR